MILQVAANAFGQRHHSQRANVSDGFGLCQRPPPATSTFPTVGLPVMVGIVRMDVEPSVLRSCAPATPLEASINAPPSIPTAPYHLALLLTEKATPASLPIRHAPWCL